MSGIGLALIGEYKKFWQSVSDIGLNEHTEARVRKKIELSNRLSIITFFIVAISTFVFSLAHGNAEVTYLVGSLMVVPLTALGLNHLGYTRYSRLVFGVFMPLMVLVIIVMLKVYSTTTNFVISEYHFYTPRYYLVAISLLPLFLIDISERFLFYLALGINVVCLLLFDFVHDVCGVGHEQFGFVFLQYYQATVMPVVLLFFMYGSISFYQTENLKHEERIMGLLTKVRQNNDVFTQELQMAKKVMERLIPETMPEVQGIKLAAFMQWSKEVGGDYYNVRKVGDGRYLMVVADVVGKGLPASIIVSTLHSYVETHLNNNKEAFRLEDFVARLNGVLCRIIEDGKFITAWMAVYDQSTGLMESVNCGHPAPIIMNAGNDDTRLLEKGGTILGFFDEHYLFETETTQLQAGDILIAYTDGVSEATDENDRLYEEERYAQFLASHKHMEPNSMLRHLQLDLRRFVNREGYDDDLTCLVIKCCS
ncbi:hypothetical protein BH09BAC1_BH09BAC1_19760 [soil metagenome]